MKLGLCFIGILCISCAGGKPAPAQIPDYISAACASYREACALDPKLAGCVIDGGPNAP